MSSQPVSEQHTAVSGEPVDKFAAERSHNDAYVGNENGRATAQAAILINGGAATAVLAFLAKDKIDQVVLYFAPLSLVIYAVGVVFGAWMMHLMTDALDLWTVYWTNRSYGNNCQDVQKYKESAARLWRKARLCFVLSMCSFLLASIILASLIVASKFVQP